MGDVSDKLGEISVLSRDGWAIQDDDFADLDKAASNLMVLGKILDDIAKAVKDAKKSLKDRISTVADDIDAKRRNPNKTLDTFAEVPKSAGGEPTDSEHGTFDDTTPPAQEGNEE